MNTKKENLAFLQKLTEKTVIYYKNSVILGGKLCSRPRYRYTTYTIPLEDFQKVIAIINEDLYLLMPEENMMGYIDGYNVIALDGKVVLLFGKENLPAEYTLEGIFLSLVRSKQNVDIYNELVKEKKVSVRLRPHFEDYYS